MLKALNFAHALVADFLQPGAIVIDATAGNGRDTEFLARNVGPNGRVFAFDVQHDAIERTRQRLTDVNMIDRVHLFHRGHEQMKECIPVEYHGAVQVIVFNLGYLPRGNKHITTLPETSLQALHAAVELLAPEGILTVMLYTGHPEGDAEGVEIARWAEELPHTEFQVLRYQFINLPNNPPWLIAIQKSATLR